MKKFLISLLAAMMILMSVVPAMADNYTPKNPANTDTPWDLTAVKFNKYLLITGVKEVPTAKFDFEVTAPTTTDPTGVLIAASGTNPTVYVGTKADKVKVAADTAGGVAGKDTLSFSNTDTLVAGPKTTETDYQDSTANPKPQPVIGNTEQGSWGSAGDIKVEYDQEYVKKAVTLDFSAAEFKEPGVYRYYLQEIPNANNPSLIKNDTQTKSGNPDNEDDGIRKWRTIDIYVEDDLDVENQSQNSNGIMGTNGTDPGSQKKLKVTGIVMYEGKLGSDKKPGVGTEVDITKNQAHTSKERGVVDPGDTAISNTTWTVTENNTPATGDTTVTTYDAYDSTKKEWTATVVITPGSSSTTEAKTYSYTVKDVPDNATSTSFTGMNFAQACENEAKAQNATRSENGAEAGSTEKNGTFVNEYETHELIVEKTVKGNQGSRDKYFKFTIEITDAGKNTVMKIDRTKHDTTTSSNNATKYATNDMDSANTQDDDNDLTNGYQLNADVDGKASTTVYLQHGESIKISGLPKGAKWTVTEVDANENGTADTASDGYKTVADEDELIEGTHTDNEKVVTGTSGETYYRDAKGVYYYDSNQTDATKKFRSFDVANKYKNSGTPANPKWEVDNTNGTHRKLSDGEYVAVRAVDDSRYSKEVTTSYINSKRGVIPTGLIMATSVGFAIVALAIALMVIVNRRREEEEEF